MVSGRFAPRLIRPIAVRSDKVDLPDVYWSSSEKRNMHGKTMTAHVESTVKTKITVSENYHVAECCMSSGKSTQLSPGKRRRANRLSGVKTVIQTNNAKNYVKLRGTSESKLEKCSLKSEV